LFGDTSEKLRNADVEDAVDFGFREARDEVSNLGGGELSYLDFGEGRGFGCNVVGEEAVERLSYFVGVGEIVSERAGELNAGPAVGVVRTHFVCCLLCLAGWASVVVFSNLDIQHLTI